MKEFISPPQLGGIFVEVEFSVSAPQRGAIFVGANEGAMQPIVAHVVGNWLLQNLALRWAADPLTLPLYKYATRWGGEGFSHLRSGVSIAKIGRESADRR